LDSQVIKSTFTNIFVASEPNDGVQIAPWN